MMAAKRRRVSRPGRVVAALVVAGVMLASVSLVVVVSILPAPAVEKPARKHLPVNVSVMRIEPVAELEDAVVLPGSIEPNSVVRVSAEVPGRVEAVECVEGRPCRAGQVLVRLNTEILQAEVDRAKATMDFDARELERVAALHDRGVATDTEHDQARTRAAASRAAYDAAKAQLDRAVIHAPAGGVLNRLAVEAGEYVAPGTVVAEIVEVDPVLAVVDVPERDIHYLRCGQEAMVFGRGPEKAGTVGRITYISELADPATRTTRVEVTVPNADRRFRSGQIVDVRLRRRVLKNVILVPLEAVIPLEDGYRAYVVERGLARPRRLELGGFRGREVRVLSGLRAGERLIVAGQYYVGPGQPVVVRPRPAVPAASGPAAGSEEARP